MLPHGYHAVAFQPAAVVRAPSLFDRPNVLSRDMRAPEPMEPLLRGRATLKPHTWRASRFALGNQLNNPRQEKHELVLDLDDLAVAIVPSNGQSFVHLSHALNGVLVGAAAGLAAWFGFIASIRQLMDSKRAVVRLRKERAYIHRHMPHVAHNPWDAKQLCTAEAMLHENRIDRNEQLVRGVFSGALITFTSTIEIFAYAATPYLLGGLSTGLAAAGAVALATGVPLISVFAGANATMQFARFHRAVKDRHYVPLLAKQNPWPVQQFDVNHFVRQRLRLIRTQAMSTGLGFTGIAVGAPLTFWGGPYGLALLVPGIAAVTVANHFESRKVEYQNPMTLEETHVLVTERQINNAMGLAFLEYQLLKNLKNEKRSEYGGMQGGRLRRLVSAPLRRLRPPVGSGEPALKTLYRFYGERINLRDRFWDYEIGVFLKNIAQGDTELAGLLAWAQERQRRVRLAREVWQSEWSTLPTLAPEKAAARLSNVLVEYKLFEHFMLHLSKHSDLRHALQLVRGKTHQITTQQFVHRVQAAAGKSPEVLARVYTLAEHLFVTTLKAWRHSRARELADLAVERKRAKHVLGHFTLKE